jgi:hypothetical protein
MGAEQVTGQLALPLGPQSRATPEEEHTFRLWQSGYGLERLAAERGITEVQMLGVIAAIWRKFGPA